VYRKSLGWLKENSVLCGRLVIVADVDLEVAQVAVEISG
jgi:hypothetical protein